MAAGVLLAVAGCTGWVLWRYAQLLAATRHALARPEPEFGPQVPSERE